ncbi:hypothetical protein HXX76_000368 [Chlamydomonas incerta]|uniref:Uncharacterized protein n=1 Tax=Chlamydomonas incerta TaxID=51695 RepID=A0A836B2Y0_CHLIN|nr:hypothetical protein HXX76_000368 [Chlamydomonas incerta]|eukprot:KAG2445764.1 hypothetical protein HXX76_000368 [Chlamydomonas incerta]
MPFTGLASGGFFGEGHAAGGFDGEGHAAGGSFDGSGGHGAMHGHGHGHVLRATGSTSTAAHAGPDAHTLEHMQSPSPATYMGRRAFSCDGRAALPMPTSVSGSATAAASTGMAPPPFTPAASCDALYNTVRDQRQQQRPAKPLEDFFTAAHQGPVAGCHGHASAGEFGYGRQQQHQQHKQLHLHLHLHQQHQHLHLQQQQQQQRLSGAGPSRMQPLQMQQHPREPPPALGSGSGSHSHLGQQPLPQAQSVRQMQLQPYPQPPSAGSSMCHADTSGTLSTLHSTGDGGSGRVLLCSLPELPGGKRLSLTTAAASGSLPAAATSPCLLGSPRPGGDGDNEALEGLLHSLERDLGIMSPAHPHRHHQHQQLQPLQPTQSSLPQLLPHPRSVGSDSNSGAHPHLLPLSGPQPHQPHPHPQPSHSHSQQPQDAAAGLPWLVREASDAPDEMLCGSGGVGGKSPRRKLQGLPPSQQQLPQHDDPHQGDVHVARRTDPGIMHRHDSAVWGARDMRREQEPSLQLQPPQRDGRGNGMCGPAAGGLRGVAFEGALAGAGPRAAGSQDWPGGSGDGFTPRSTADGYAAQPPPFNGQAGDASAGGGHRHFCPVHGSPFATSAGPWSQQAPLDSRGSGGGAVGPLSGGGGSAAWGGQHPHHPPSHPHHPHHHHHHHLRQHPHQHPHPHHAHLPHCPLHQPHCPLHRHAHAHALSGAHSMPQPLPSYGRDCWPTLLPEGGGGGFAADGSAMELSAMQLRSQQQPYGGQQQPYGQQQLAGGGGSGGSGSRHHAAGPGPGSRLTSARVGPYPRGTQPGGPHSPFSAAGAVRSSAGYDGLRGSGGGAGPAGGLFGPEAPRQQPMPMHGSHMEWASAPTVSFAQGPHNHHQHQPHHNQYQNHHHQQHLRGSSVPRCYSLQNFEDAGPSRLLQPLQPLQPLQQPLLQPLQQQQQQQSAAADLHTTPNLFEGALQREPSIPHSTMNPSSISNGCAGGPGRGTSMDVGGRFLVEHADCVTSDTDLDLLVDNLIWNPAPEASWISR